jgi:hypothetical protein
MKRLFTLRALFWFIVSLVTVYALFVSIENWTGARALAAAKQKLADEGETLDFQRLLPTPIPDAQNFCAVEPLKGLTNPKNQIAPELEALKMPKMPPAGHASGLAPDLQPMLAELVKAGIGKEGQPAAEMLAALDSAHPLLPKLAQTATQRSQALFTPQLGEGQEHFTLFEMQLPHYMPVQKLARLLVVRAHLAIAAGNAAEAVRSIQGCLRLSAAASAEPVLISTMVSIALHTNAQEAVRGFLRSRLATAADLDVLAADLQRIDYLRVMLQAVRGEMAASTQTIEAISSRPESRLSFLGVGSYAHGEEATLFERLLGRLTPQGLLQHGEARVIEQELKHMLLPLKRGGRVSLLEELQAWENDIAASRSLLNPHGWLVGMMMPAYSSVMRQVYYNEALRRQSLASIHIEKHRLEHGSLPAALESPLLDPIDQKPLRYRVENGGYVLWSLALDGEDDQGRALEKNEKETDKDFTGDWVWRMK